MSAAFSPAKSGENEAVRQRLLMRLRGEDSGKDQVCSVTVWTDTVKKSISMNMHCSKMIPT